MADFISQIQNIANVYQTTPTTSSAKIDQIATLIKNGTVDSVNFSKEGQSLFGISQIDSQFDTLLGLPQTDSSSKQRTLDSLRQVGESLLQSGSLSPASIDYTGIMQNIEKLFSSDDIDEEGKKKMQELSAQLQSYIQNLSITQLFSTNSSSTSTLFDDKLTASEQADLGKIATQLNSVIFTANDESATSFLEELNSLYGLTQADTKESEDFFSLFTERNTLLSSVLLNRNVLSNYGDLL